MASEPIDLRVLADVVVLHIGDEGTALAGEYLAELGAGVVRVEDQRGNVLRSRGALRNAVRNAGKRSVAIDTSSDEAWAGSLRWCLPHTRHGRLTHTGASPTISTCRFGAGSCAPAPLRG